MFQVVPLSAFGIGFVLIFLFVGLLTTALWAWVSYWVYQDATERRMDSPAMWGVVTFVAGVVGLLVYFLVREDA